jgi:hypothetical protein
MYAFFPLLQEIRQTALVPSRSTIKDRNRSEGDHTKYPSTVRRVLSLQLPEDSTPEPPWAAVLRWRLGSADSGKSRTSVWSPLDVRPLICFPLFVCVFVTTRLFCASYWRHISSQADRRCFYPERNFMPDFLFSLVVFPAHTYASRIKCVVNERVILMRWYTHAVLCEQMGVQYFLIFTMLLVKFKRFLGFEAVSFGNCLPLGTASYPRIICILSIISFPMLCNKRSL